MTQRATSLTAPVRTSCMFNTTSLRASLLPCIASASFSLHGALV